MASGLDYPQALIGYRLHPLDPVGFAAFIPVPLFAHKRDSRRRIRNNRINRAIRKGLEYVQAIAVV
jgi:hypothetical protein